MELFEKAQIGTLTVKNRFIRSALWLKGAEQDGHINDFIVDTYETLARGGVGLILTGYAHISKEEQPNPRMKGIYDDSFIEAYRHLTTKVHAHDSKIAMQIVFGGSQSHHPDAASMNILAPSAVHNRVTGLSPKAATKEDIKRIVKLFGDAAERVKKAGFDGVQIHAAHGYFLSMFLTPYYNRRTDEYNGDIHNRARIIYEVYQEIRGRVGKDFPVMIKLNFNDFMDEGEGLTPEDAGEVFKRLDELGMDLFEVSATNESSGKGLTPAWTKLTTRDKESYFRDATAKIAESVTAPVVLMGGNRSVELMEGLLNSTKIQYFSIARPLLSEPDLINQWQDNREHKPKCVSCNRCWLSEPNSCVLNKRQ
ncbi:NADH:flavin oxidoreductase [Desulfosediminicola sp.]|uniref:NADH:flavin oxidoreductase n=1 Tax=Desulfosediminicola sp. TaxID=2886825 RepID=UPI003AF2A726